MPIALGFEYDVFVSYAHNDNLPVERPEGWVSEFVQRIEAALCQQVGQDVDALKILFDREETGANYQLAKLRIAAKQSALFLAIGSPSYVSRDWPRRELESFAESAPDLSRLFAIEYLPLNPDERYPSPLDDHKRFEFWKRDRLHHTPVPLSPASEEFAPLVRRLAADMRNKLFSLRLLSGNQSRRTAGFGGAVVAGPQVESNGPSTQTAGCRRTVLIAQTTDDVEDEAEQLRVYLGQYSENVTILPTTVYPQGGDAFRDAVARDLAQADVFVQLLGRRAGRMPPDLPEGYIRCQVEAAKAACRPIMQWRRPDIDVNCVADAAFKNILTAETVVASGLEAFKRQVLDWLRRPEPKPRVSRSSTVFINADTVDMKVAKEVERACLQNALTTILPMSGLPPEASRKDLVENLTDCDILVFIYGDTTPEWIRSQLKFFSKVQPKRDDPKLLAICIGPPSPKADIGISFPNAHVIICPDAWNLEQIRTLISEIRD